MPNVPFRGMSIYLDRATMSVGNWPVTERGMAAPHSLTQSNLMITTVGSESYHRVFREMCLAGSSGDSIGVTMNC